MEQRALPQSASHRPSSSSRASRAARNSAGPVRFDGIRATLRVLDAFLSAIESTVWELRLTVEELTESTSRGLAGAKADLGDAGFRLARLTQTGASLSLVATSYRLHVTKAAFLPRRIAARSLEELHHKNARRLRLAAETHGGAFLKVGQLLSSRPDIVPASYVTELSVLQDAAPQVDFAAVKAALEAELSQPLEEIFLSFDETPIAAASIGQVHRATTKDGLEVAVKVQRPGIAPLVAQDLALLELFLEALAPMLPPMDLGTITREIRSSVMRELDFGAEAADGMAVGRFLAGSPGIVIPEVVESLSTPRVLVTHFVKGRKITDVLDELAALASQGDESAAARRDHILGTVLEMYVRQILEGGRFQADPHPGNLLVTPDDEVVLLDFGCTQSMSPETRKQYLSLVSAFVVNDLEGVVRNLDALGFKTRSGKHDTLLHFAEALLGSFAKTAGEARFPTKEELEAEARALYGSMERDPVEGLPPEFVMIARVFGTLGGLFMHYRPQIDVTARVLPVVARAMAS